MPTRHIALGEFAAAGLGSQEILAGAALTPIHESLHAGYLLHHERGWEAVRDMIVADIRATLDLGAKKRAADLLIVLRLFLAQAALGRPLSPRAQAAGPRENGSKPIGPSHPQGP